ncbi:hypothetical protein AFCA_005082 [Aspergillus flavus]|uniref:GRAM domain protein n=2 Tax=Aspergillus subgen. Circumdati TaxID=2720871 RepID=A0AB74C508_ASPFL|nr:GRAM domain protein [Aspergillus flavus]RAQ61609.1 GRAM domain protein [Aspergillus flavus]RMZ41171.1 GRAM domain protein [Aspergillus flavus]UDD57580.1 hypothetical protein AFCA_005082 [Aspergillus flavus]
MEDNSLNPEAHPAFSSDMQSIGKLNRSKTSIDDALGSSGRSNGRSSSIDSTSDRPKSQAGEGTDSAKAGPSGFSKLLAARKKRKKKENQKATEELPTQFELEGEKDAQDRPDEPSEDRPPSAANNDGLNPQNDEVNLLTDDSEPERTPSLTAQKSHAGFYTTSSPLTKTTSTDANDTDSAQADVESAVSGPSATAHSESNADTELSRPTSQPSSTLGVPEDRGGKKRSVSPGRRWKGAFGSSQDKKDSNRDRSSSTQSEGKKGGGLFGNSRRSSTSSKKAPTIVAESPPPLPPLIRTDVKEEKPAQPSDHAAPSTPPRRTIPAPHTTVTPPTPRTEAAANLFSSPDVTESPDSLKGKDPLPPGVVVSPSGNMISHRRVRSASSVSHKPSKLSNSISALGPTIEEAKATSKTNLGTQQTGFFSSVFSAAQNAASTLSSSLNTQSKTRSPSQQVSTESENISTKDGESSQNETQESSKTERKKPLAIETLGTGDLDFSHLDIAVPPGGSVSTPDGVVITKPDIPSDKRKNTAVHQRDEEAARLEDRHAARAVTMAYEKPSEVSVVPPSDESLELQSTSSLPRDATGDHTSPSGSVLDGEISVRPSRSGSVRSRLTRRRHRGSSAATASTAAAAGASAMALGIPGGNSSVPRLTGFAVASKKRNRDFHQLFRSVPEDDYLIEDYSCALQREIILAGRIYVSEGHICFSSNILGWVTTLVISFDEIVAIEKESTAMVFPNAIAIQTLHARHTFRSLLSRESTYDLMVNIWKINHPTLKSSVNGTRVEQGTGDKTEKAGEESEGGSEDEDEIYDEDEDGDNADSFFEPGDASVNGSDKSLPLKGLSRQASGNLPVNGTAPATSNTNGDPRGGKSANENVDGDFPGPTTHGPTTYTDPAGQYDKVIKDEIIPAPLGKVYSYVFGPASTNFMPKFLVDNQKSGELQFDIESGGLTNESRTRQYSYIKPLNGSIGPKQTKCISTETLDFLDLEKAVLVTLSTQTPDVPSGNVFCTKTKYLFTWAANNQTRFLMTCTIEWSGKSWLKGPIEKGAIDGQGTFGSDLISALRAAVAPRARAASKVGGKGKGRRKRGDVANEEAAAAAAKAASDATKQQAQTWGPLEPIRGVLEPIAGILKPLWNGNLAVLVIGILLFLIFFRTPSQPSMLSHDIGCPGYSLPQRLAAYEEMWRREESELWSWLEDRVGMDGMVFPTVNRPGESRAHERARKIQSGRDFINKLDEDKMSVREMDHAIRTTREKLDTLEKILTNRKMQATAGEDTMHSEL